jgi:sec-independent protein translocase protein TatB
VFSLGGGEVLVILLVALIVLGPDKLPEAARKIGNVMGEVRRMSAGFQNEMRAAIEDAGRQEPAKPNLEPVPDERKPAPGDVDGSGSQSQATDDSAA